MRHDNRAPSALRPVTIERQYTRYAPGSVLISMGHTKVLCQATIEERVPPFLRDSNQGWVTAEYGMLPASTHTRMRREVKAGKASGRTQEIQRLIGRSLRSVVDLNKLGERSITIDCDVIQADGGTRTAAISGGMMALWDAVQSLLNSGTITQNPIQEWLAAISVGSFQGTALLDLCYEEDSKADVDMNIVMTESGKFVELQGTAEESPFDTATLMSFIDLGTSGINALIDKMKKQAGVSF